MIVLPLFYKVSCGFSCGKFEFLTNKLLLWEEQEEKIQKKNRGLLIAVAGSILVIAFSLIVKFKPYPTDYVDGLLIVDPYKMQSDYFSAAVAFFAVLLGHFIESRWIKFTTQVSLFQKILRVLFGSIGIAIIYYGFSKFIKPLIPSYHLYCIIKNFLLYFFVIAGNPLVFTAIEKKLFGSYNTNKN